jgi:AmpD protein
VSAHCVIRRDGTLEQYVPFDKRAWHAGQSRYCGRKRCNDFSIGIELEGTDQSAYTDKQYQCLVEVTELLLMHYPKLNRRRIIGHEHIAPGRKTDPGSGFDWPRYLNQL